MIPIRFLGLLAIGTPIVTIILILGGHSLSPTKDGQFLNYLQAFQLNLSSQRLETPTPAWQSECPLAVEGPQSLVIAGLPGGRLGNYIWEYLSAWGVAKRYGLFLAVHNDSANWFSKCFEPLNTPILEELQVRCNLSSDFIEKGYTAGTQTDMLAQIEKAGPEIKLLFLQRHIVHTEETVIRWRELREELRIKSNLRDYAQIQLHHLKKAVLSKTLPPGVNASLPLEFVGVHVRRTDYLGHVTNNYPGARAADENFFRHAMDWLRKRLKRPLAFVLISDDPKWCHEKLEGPDSYFLGNGDENNPCLDLALLAACNHTIFSYGTFSLTAAMLANGRFTLLYDTQNNTNSKEMEFATFLPGWHILDDNGNENYHYGQHFKLTFVKG